MILFCMVALALLVRKTLRYPHNRTCIFGVPMGICRWRCDASIYGGTISAISVHLPASDRLLDLNKVEEASLSNL